MNQAKNLTMLIIALICIATAMALPQPKAPDDPFDNVQTLSITGESTLPDIDITPSTLSIMGSECSKEYAATGDYCSGAIRIYYQCLQTSDGLEWQQRSENCGDYPGGGRCVETDQGAECVDFTGDTTYGKKMLIIAISLIVAGLIAGALLTFAGMPYFGVPLGIILIAIGVMKLIEFFQGGV